MDNRRTAVVVEDDRDVGDAISGLLAKAGFEVTVASNGIDALAVIRDERPDLVTLDLTLPDIDGVEVCRQVRLVSDCYVIVVSGRTAELDRLIGLEVGADDYLVKPFSMRELQARVAALFRRPRSSDLVSPEAAAASQQAHADATPDAFDSRTGCDDLLVDSRSREVRVDGEEIELTRTEFDLLAHLVSHPGVVVAREDLLRAVWSTDFVPDSTHVVDVHLANLRRKLRAASADDQWIRTIRGVGFRFDPCCA
ncbi:response regulator transcription factor [Nocardioides glacieisoli]|uniref:Response regulator transcription factor n=1 Tax=Nocardioides glacieisoli TaxID=1168730 RepID=A0A4Q2RP20_9ACTN|nr:response regulator transcription factor [Nocardioides glacieisoli]RYB89399.1 response regulator transcription factor [Nocardioides glacieisoli]